MEKVSILSEFQAVIKAPKNQTNNFGNYKYRSCEDIVEAIKPIISEKGFYLTLSDEIIMLGNRFYIKSTATLSNGEVSFSACGFAREEEAKKGMDSAQITGSASSYARKYALNGLFAIDDTKDADFTNNGKEEPKPSLQRLVHGTETFKKVIERVKSTEVLLCDLEKHYTFDAKVKAEIELAIIQRKK